MNNLTFITELSPILIRILPQIPVSCFNIGLLVGFGLIPVFKIRLQQKVLAAFLGHCSALEPFFHKNLFIKPLPVNAEADCPSSALQYSTKKYENEKGLKLHWSQLLTIISYFVFFREHWVFPSLPTWWEMFQPHTPNSNHPVDAYKIQPKLSFQQNLTN